MNCHQLASQIERMQPAAEPRDVARLCLLMTNFIEDVDALENEKALQQAWRDTAIRVQAATDQHAAMTQELDDLSNSDPAKFSPEQIWILIRAIKVQSQILQLYVGEPALDV